MAAPLAATRAIVFDLDGTLVDSLDDIADNLNAALVEAGLPARSRDAIQSWVGHGITYLVAQAVPDAAHVADVVARYQRHYGAAPYARTRVYPGLAAALDRIAPGRILAVLSNKPHALVVQIVAELLAAWPIAAAWGELAGRPPKPDPAALLALVAELGMAREQCAYVGDSEVDVATARAAGITSIAVAWGLRDAAALVGADYLVSTPAELAALFQ